MLKQNTKIVIINLLFLIIVNVSCKSSLNKKPFFKQSSTNYGSTTSNNNISGPIVTLGCSMCQQILNLTSAHFHAMNKESLFDFINTEHCSKLGLFKNICFLTITKYFDKLYDSYASNFKIEDTNILPNFQKICTTVTLCSPEESSAFCKTYYITDTHNPLSEKETKKYEKREL